MNYNPSPKLEFCKNPENIKAHHALVENEFLRRAFEIAMFEIHRRAAEQTPADNFNACAASHLRQLGAQDFVETFLNLAEMPVAAARKDTANLPSNVATIPNVSQRKN